MKISKESFNGNTVSNIQGVRSVYISEQISYCRLFDSKKHAAYTVYLTYILKYLKIIISISSKYYISIRTNVECGGHCSASSQCGAFYLEGSNCYLLASAGLFLYTGETSPKNVYMLNDHSGNS